MAVFSLYAVIWQRGAEIAGVDYIRGPSKVKQMNHSLLIGSLLLLICSSCVQSNKLAQHPLDGKRVAVVSEIPQAPFADFNMTIFDRVGQDVPIANMGEPGSREIPPLVVHKSDVSDAPQGPATEVHALIDSVLIAFDMSAHMIDATHNRSASMMRFEPVADSDGAEYQLEVAVEDYGIGADAWDGTAYFEVMGQVKLVEAASGATIWEGEVMEITTVSSALLQVGRPAGDLNTPADMSRLSFLEMQSVLKGLAAYASIQLTAPFQEAYFKTYNRESARFDSRQQDDRFSAASPRSL
ncbi:MAG: hypothetical protein AAF564_18580 [Bacteroidota bacterium]